MLSLAGAGQAFRFFSLFFFFFFFFLFCWQYPVDGRP